MQLSFSFLLPLGLTSLHIDNVITNCQRHQEIVLLCLMTCSSVAHLKYCIKLVVRSLLQLGKFPPVMMAVLRYTSNIACRRCWIGWTRRHVVSRKEFTVSSRIVIRTPPPPPQVDACYVRWIFTEINCASHRVIDVMAAAKRKRRRNVYLEILINNSVCVDISKFEKYIGHELRHLNKGERKISL